MELISKTFKIHLFCPLGEKYDASTNTSDSESHT